MADHPYDQLTAYVDGALSQGEAAEVAAHLAECESCRDTVADLVAVRGLLARVQTPVPHPSLFPRTMARLAEVRPRRMRVPRWLVAAGAVLAMAALALQVRVLPPQMSEEAQTWFYRSHAQLSATHPMADVSLTSYLSTPLPYQPIDEASVEGTR